MDDINPGGLASSSDSLNPTATPARRWVLLATGGTIAGLAPDGGDGLAYRAAQLGVQALAQAVPASALHGRQLQAEQLAQVDSKDMDWPVWRALLARLQTLLADPQVDGVLITHGTDTLEETAWLLQALLAPTKPVVLTCAMRPANAPQPDGPQNLRDALAVLQAPQAQGVLVVCAGQVHEASRVRKRHPYRLDAFDSGEAGPLAQVEAGRVRWLQQPCPLTLPQPLPDLARLQAHDGPMPWVELLTSHAAAQGRLVDLLVADGVRGLVVAGTGNGTVHQALLAALLRAQAAGVVVWVSTRCSLGQVLAQEGDVLPTVPLPPVSARLALSLHLLPGVA